MLLQRLQLEFNPSVPEFVLRETVGLPELYAAVFLDVPDIDGKAIGRIQQELEKGAYHPIGGDDTSAFLKRLAAQLSPRGQFVAETRPQGWSDDPCIGRDPVIFLRSRTLGFATALDAVLQDLKKREDVPRSLFNVVGIDAGRSPESLTQLPEFTLPNEDEGILLSKPANVEQLEIARQLDAHACVLVQGPPGTGKTHTIANLIGHLLSKGKTILVTSHTTKALRVLRDQVTEELRALCVNVLKSDAESQKQLESSVETIVERLSAGSERLTKKAERLANERRELLKLLKGTRQQLFDARSDEYRSILIAGKACSPSDAARLVADRKMADSWIPGTVTSGVPAPLPPQEFSELYRSNGLIRVEDEAELDGLLPNMQELLTFAQFEHLCLEKRRLGREELASRDDLWTGAVSSSSVGRLEQLLDRLKGAIAQLAPADSWLFAVTDAGRTGAEHRQVWDNLLALVDSACQQAAQGAESILQHQPCLPERPAATEQIRILEEIVSHLSNGAKLNWWTTLVRASWKPVLNSAKVASGSPRTAEHFRSLLTVAQLKVTREGLVGRWYHQVVNINGPDIAKVQDQPEAVASRLQEQCKDALNWYHAIWIQILNQLTELGFRWEAFMKEVPPDLSPQGELRRLREVVTNRLPGLLAVRLNQAYAQRAEETLAQLREIAKWALNKNPAASTLTKLIEAVSRMDSQTYREAFERLGRLHQLNSALRRRKELLGRLSAHAPEWANAIVARIHPHDGSQVPGDPNAAWLWKQLYDELERRAAVSIPKLQGDAEQLTAKLQEVTARLIDSLAWAAQIERTNLPQRQALIGWLQTVKRIGKGTGRRVPELQAEARRLMTECRTAVPVWIMPLARVAESFDPRVTRFDVVIIDEASQSDAMALLAFYMGREVLVVGDDQQVSPDAVGQDLGEVKRLIDQYLGGIPNAHLYDGQMSIYDLAKASFGGTICLREHFRCATGIIQFSNYLSYNGNIKPLRDTSAVLTRPHTIAYRVDGQLSGHQVNQIEAVTVASLVVAATEQPEFKKNDLNRSTTFGVISLVGDDQARAIEQLLRRRLSPVEYERRRILCGNAAQFQGDERDVMFLSMVDARMDGPLALREAPLFKKRFNVAASRARNQMWVTYSLNPQVDLKPGDLRRRLIEHAQDPSAINRLLERAEAKAESELERQIIRRLTTAGYRVLPQVKVGYYRIDLVIEGSNRRLAVECDGERFHPADKLQEDLERQAVLERLGWVFERVRGSLFFRDPERALEPVFERLQQLGIEPNLTDEAGTRSDTSSDLRERVILRAAELRKQWEEAPDEPAVLADSDESEDDFPEHSTLDDGPGDLFSLAQPNSTARTIEDIPAEHIRACLLKGLPETGEIEKEAFLRTICRMLGFDRLGQRIRKRLNRIIAGEVRSGRLGTNWGKVWRRRK
ncbi:MAG: hypothetical protein A3I71_00580 [Omnitrophica WOR_2 bacterium RIFCSPLOWO2_02_FULL_63_16]|nr:MAG: hypothetical protein A3I71_00580 [Omnitrophica WOR_2 bacterium RIFCSPLOWO2_02_FULL_63_16]